MIRRGLFALALTGALGVAMASDFEPRVGPPVLAGPAERPNIILILADDLDAKSISVMPQLKTLLSDSGTTFANFFVTSPLCCPSRASILRGQYTHNHQVLTNDPPTGGHQRWIALGHEQSTIGVWLKSAGYRTAFLGKYLNWYPQGAAETHVPPGWDDWVSGAGPAAYNNFAYRLIENGRIVAYGRAADDYLTDVLARKAADVIRRAARDGAPFFIYLATYAPHEPATPAPRHQGQFASVTLPRPPSFNEADVSDKPNFVRSRASLSSEQITQMEERYRGRLQSLLAVDELIASVVAALQGTGQLNRTYIFFTSDHGYHMGEHRLPDGKNTAYEEDIRVPMIVRGPGVPTARVIDHIGLNIDLAPTFAEIGGATVPGFVDGRSLVPLLVASPPRVSAWRQAFAVERYRWETELEVFAVRTRDGIYVEYSTGQRELYNLQRDPYQLDNLAATTGSELLERLAARLTLLKRCAASSCRTAEDAPISVLPSR